MKSIASFGRASSSGDGGMRDVRDAYWAGIVEGLSMPWFVMPSLGRSQ